MWNTICSYLSYVESKTTSTKMCCYFLKMCYISNTVIQFFGIYSNICTTLGVSVCMCVHVCVCVCMCVCSRYTLLIAMGRKSIDCKWGGRIMETEEHPCSYTDQKLYWEHIKVEHLKTNSLKIMYIYILLIKSSHFLRVLMLYIDHCWPSIN